MKCTARGMVKGAAVIALVAFPCAAVAHEKWFADAKGYPTQWEQIFRFPQIVGVLLALAVTTVLAVVWRGTGGRALLPGPEAFGATPEGRARFYALVPRDSRDSRWCATDRVLESPGSCSRRTIHCPGLGLQAGRDADRHWLERALRRSGQGGWGCICLLWLLGTGVVGLESMLENAHYLGFGAFFLLTGRGPYAVDRLLFPAFEPTPQLSRLAMPSLRIGTGLGLTIVAFTEKLANPELARAFLHQHPLNFSGWLHIPLSDDIFVVCAGSTELLIGLCLIFGIFPRLSSRVPGCSLTCR